jgi:hypothetical protein
VSTSDRRGSGRLSLSQCAHRLLALIARGPVEDQDAVEVVDLVLDHARLESGCLDHDLFALLVQRPDADVDRALDVDEHGRQTEAALLGYLLLVPAPFDLRVDQGHHRGLLLDAVDEQAMEHAELRRGQADAQRIVHQGTHAGDLGAQGIVDLLHRPGPGAQHRIPERAHVGERRRATRGDLGVELFWLLDRAIIALQFFVSEVIDRFVSHNFSLVSRA